jgi:WD40 repeat protein
MAQEATWLDEARFAVGRWDGSLSIFSFEDLKSTGPEITVAASDESSEGVQMLQALTSTAFVSSGGESQLTVWSVQSSDWKNIVPTQFPYETGLGTANSAALYAGQTPILAVGHASGFLSLWKVVGADLVFGTAVDLRNPKPTNPWDLHNIRGVQTLAGAPGVVTGSEDGFISVVELPTGKVLSQTVYNPAAERGINSIALSGNELLVANCCVGSQDRNLWYYSLESGGARYLDSARLVVNPQAPQVFNFSVAWGFYKQGPCFFSSTEEGALWMGTANGESLNQPIGYLTLTPTLGSAIAGHFDGRMAVVGYDLHQFDTSNPTS